MQFLTGSFNGTQSRDDIVFFTRDKKTTEVTMTLLTLGASKMNQGDLQRTPKG